MLIADVDCLDQPVVQYYCWIHDAQQVFEEISQPIQARDFHWISYRMS